MPHTGNVGRHDLPINSTSKFDSSEEKEKRRIRARQGFRTFMDCLNVFLLEEDYNHADSMLRDLEEIPGVYGAKSDEAS